MIVKTILKLNISINILLSSHFSQVELCVLDFRITVEQPKWCVMSVFDLSLQGMDVL